MVQKVIFVDLDKTLTLESTWLLLNVRLGITPEEDHQLFESYLKHELEYDKWITALVDLYKSRGVVTKQELETFAQTIELRHDAMMTIAALKEKGYHVVILSGSVNTIVEAIAKKIGADDWRATSTLVFDEQEHLVDIIASGDEAPAKETIAERYANKYAFNLRDAYSVDDGGNGEKLFQRTKGILLGDNEKLKSLAWKQVQALSEIPALLP